MNTVSGDRKVSDIDRPAGSTCRQIADQDLSQDFAARIAGVTEQCNGLLRRRAAFRTVRVPLVAMAFGGKRRKPLL